MRSRRDRNINIRVWRGHTSGLPWVIRVHEVLKENKPNPSLLDPAPNKLRIKSWRPLSARQMTEIAVKRGNAYCGIHSQKKMAEN